MTYPRTIRDCNVAVVGGAGFLGSHLVNHLVDDRNCTVLVMDNLITGRRKFIHKRARFEHIDITGSEDRMRKLFVGSKIQYVFNYAAMPYIPVSFEHPIRVADVNYMGALKVINAAQEAGVEAILQVSSAEIYGDGKYGQEAVISSGDEVLDEDSIVRPHSSYGVAKAAVDNAVQVRWREAKTPCIALRQFNCIGERETHPYVVPEIISQLDAQRASVCCIACRGTGEGWKNQGNGDGEGFRPGGCTVCDATGWRRLPVANVCTICHGECVLADGALCTCYDSTVKEYAPVSGSVKLGNNSFRDFQYAGDAVRMATELLEKGKFGEVYNMGSESGAKVYDLAKQIGKIMDFADTKVVLDPVRVRPWEIWHLASSNKKLYSVIEARPLVNLEEGLKRTIRWYQNNNSQWAWE